MRLMVGIGLLALCSLASAASGGATMKAGYGKACITPPMGSAAGKGMYGTLKSVFDDVYVRAVYVETDGEKVLIAAADVVGLYPNDVDYFTARICQATDLEPEQVVLHATHTHSGPASRWETGELLEPFGVKGFCGSADYRAAVASGFVNAARDAVASAEPCEIAYSEARVTGVASNRRVPVEGTDKVVMRNSRPSDDLRAKPEGVIDPLVRLVLFKSGKRVIGICNYSCHPSAAGGDHSPYLSADFPAYGMRAAEKNIRGLQLMHLTGTCGDINPGAHVTKRSTAPEDRLSDLKLLGDRYGEALTEAVRSARGWSSSGDLLVKHARVGLPLAADRPTVQECRKQIAEAAETYKQTGKPPAELHRLLQHYHAGLRSRKGTISTRIAAMRLGGVCFTFLPGEIFLRFGESLREVVPGPLLNTALCHDYSVNYVVPPECFDEGGYEPTATRLSPGAYGKLLDAAKKLLGEVKPQPTLDPT